MRRFDKTIINMGKLVAVLAAVFGLSGLASAANLSVRLSDGITPLTCADGAACDTNLLPGAVTINTTYGALTVSLGGTGSGTPALPPMNMDLSYNLTQSAGAPSGTYTISVSENGLSGNGIQWTALVNGNQGAGFTTAFNAYADAGNALFAQTTTLCTNGPVGTASVVFNCPNAAPFTSAAFSLTEKITLTAPAGTGNVSGDARLTPGKIPEPASILLLGMGLVGLAAWGRKRLSK